METKNIQESKVNFQTAVLAKELGFDEICYYHFGIDGEEFASRLPDGSKNSNWAKCTARPTLAHLQTWLREAYKIIVYVAPLLPDCEEFGFEVYCVESKKEISTERFHKSYDKTLETGLVVGLYKLKEILKKQNTVKTQL